MGIYAAQTAGIYWLFVLWTGVIIYLYYLLVSEMFISTSLKVTLALAFLLRCTEQLQSLYKRRVHPERVRRLSIAARNLHPVKYITNQVDCDEAVSHMLGSCEIGLDMEFDQNRYAYGTTLCLIQVNCAGKIYLLDPLSDINLKRFYKEIVENESIEKIIHAPSEDIRILQSLGVYPASIFDSERCAKLLNFSRTSLAAVALNLLNITLDKAEQTSNWIKRPLSDKQIEYAALDVVHLSTLKRHILDLAKNKGIVDWIHEENAVWTKFRADLTNDNIRVAKKDAARMSEFEIHCYRELLVLRDRYSRTVNKPAHFVIPKEKLIDMSLSKNKNAPIIFKTSKNVHPVLRKVAVEREFAEALRSAKSSAKQLKLNTTVPCSADYEISDEEKRTVALSIYPNLYEKLREKFGQFTASYILPNKLIVELATNRTKIEDIEFLYRRKLFSDVVTSHLS